MTGTRKWSEHYFLASVFGAAVILLVTLLLPLGFDNDLYQSMGWALYAYHGLPYVGSWDHNFPGIVFVHWASIALFGASDLGFRLFDYFVHIVFAGFYYRFLRNWLSPQASFLAVIIFVLYYASGLWGLAGQRDTYAAFLLLGAASAFVSLRSGASKLLWNSFLVGIFCGTAFLFRPTYVFFSIAFFILLLDVPQKWRAISFFLGGCVLPILAFLLPYFFIRDGLLQVYYTLIRFNLDVYSSVSVPINLWSRGRAPIYLFGIIGLFFALRQSPSSRLDKKMFILFTVSALASPIMMGKYFTYHFEPFVLIAMGFAALGLSGIVKVVSNLSLRVTLIVVSLALFTYEYYPRHLFEYYFNARMSSDSPLEETYERVLSDSLYGLAAQREVIHYIYKVTTSHDTVEYVSIFPGLRWRLNRPGVSRFTSIVPLVAYSRKVPAYGDEWRREYIASLERVAPRYIIVSRSIDWWPFVGKTNDSAVHSIPEFDSLLSVNYSPDTVIGGFALYHKNK